MNEKYIQIIKRTFCLIIFCHFKHLYLNIFKSLELKKLAGNIIFFLAINNTCANAQITTLVLPIKSIIQDNAFNVRQIVKDQFGFMWIATQEGLIRFDSKNSEQYNTYSNASHLIESADVRGVMIDSTANCAWFISSGGALNAVNLVTGSVVFKKNFSTGDLKGVKLFTKLCAYKNRIYLTSNRGVYVFNKENKTLEAENDISLSALDIDDAIIIEDIFLILVKNGGIIEYDLNKKKIIKEIRISNSFQKNDMRYFDIAGDKDEVYIASTAGVIALSKRDRSFEIDSIKLNFIPKTINKQVSGLCIDKDNNIWFSNEANLIKATLKKKTFSIIKNMLPDNSIDILSSVYNIFCDDNNIWLGCQQGIGFIKNSNAPFISILSSSDKRITVKQAYYIYPVTDSTLYSCAENGLFYINSNQKKTDLIDTTKAYDFIFKDPFGNIIVSNTDGLFRLNKHILSPLEVTYKEFASIGKLRINSCVKLNDSCLVFGSENYKGVIEWNFKKRILRNYKVAGNAIELKENVTNNIYRLTENSFVILGDAFLGILDKKEKSYKTLVLYNSAGKRYSLFFDLVRIRNRYFLACYGLGVVVLDASFNKIGEITVKEGLSNNGVYKLLPWRDSLLFITTNNGLNVYNIRSGKIKQFYKSDGLHSSVFEETSGNYFNDKIYCGGAEGLSVIYPANLYYNAKPPLLYFNKIKIEIADSRQIDTMNLLAKKYFIPNNTLQTTVTFSGINYINPERTTYQYRIKEKSENWINLNTQNFVTLIGQPPGTYHLQVKAANEDGVWSEPKELTLIFEPKWYQTWWFYLLIALTVAGILYALYRYRISQIKKQHEIRKNIATDLHDDLGSTLNSVKVFTNLAISGVKQEESLQQVKDNLTEATMSLRDMIWVLDDSLDTVDELITRLKQFAIPVAAASNIEATIKADSDVNNRQLTKEEKRNLFLICKEAINNSIKYSGATQIDVSIIASGKKIQIDIADNGKGFNVNEVKKGYGLKNMQYRAGQVKYKAALISSPGKGTHIAIKPA